MDFVLFISRLGLAVLFGTLIGLERQWHQKLAGLRTNTLVSAGSAIFVLISLNLNGESAARIISQIITGVGFIGAGVIMKDGFSVHGLNTAATLWVSSAIGAMTGLGYNLEAAAATGAVLIIHMVQRPIANMINKRPVSYESSLVTYLIKVNSKLSKETTVRALLMQTLNDESVELKSVKTVASTDTGCIDIFAEINATGKRSNIMERFVAILSLEKDVNSVSWEVTGHTND